MPMAFLNIKETKRCNVLKTVASECGIALGSLYNYFSSKSELLSATIEAVWKDIFQMGKTFTGYLLLPGALG